MSIRSDSPSAPELSSQEQLESYGYKQELKRSVSTMDLLIYGLIFMVPIAPGAIFGVVYNSAGGMVPLVYAIGLVVMIFTALSYAHLLIPALLYVFAAESMGGIFSSVPRWAWIVVFLVINTPLRHRARRPGCSSR